MAELRVGAIGTGWVSTARHLPAIQSHHGARLEAVCDRNRSRAAEVAERFGAPRWYDDVDAFLASGVDVVAIGTPPWSHHELTVRALDAGCHVFCEKPMALTAADADAMVFASEAAGKILCVAHNFLFSRSVQRADAALGGTAPSYVWGAQLSSKSRRLPEWYEDLPGGLLLDESPHLLYVLTHYCGGPLRLVSARATRTPGERWPATVELSVEGSVSVGQMTMCFETPISEWHVGIVTPSRVLGLDLFRDIVTSVGPDHAHKALDIAKTSARVISDHVAGYVSSGVRLAAGRQFWGHDVLIGRFLDACATNGRSPVDPRQSASIVALTDHVLDELGLRIP